MEIRRARCEAALLGVLYDISLPALIAASIALQLAAIPFLLVVARRLR